MQHVHFLKILNNSLVAAMGEPLQDMEVYGRFPSLDSGASRLTDESTILKFRHTLELFGLTKFIFAEVAAIFQSKGL
jgi:IS5 family transposase